MIPKFMKIVLLLINKIGKVLIKWDAEQMKIPQSIMK